MATDGTHGHGTVLRLVDGTASTTIAQIRDVDGPEASADAIDISNTDSANKRREFIAGMVDEGEVSFDLVFKASEYAKLKALVGGANEAWEIELPDNGTSTGSTFEFEGFVQNLGPSMPYEDAITANCTIKVSGDVTFTSAS